MPSKRSRHAIDLIFPISLLFLFAATAIAVLLLSAGVYSSITEKSSLREERFTPLSYIEEKLRQNDTADAIRLVRVEGQDCLAIYRTISGEDYVTYIYEDDGRLKELFMQTDADMTLEDGDEILELSDLTITEPSPGILRIVATDTAGGQSSLITAERSSH